MECPRCDRTFNTHHARQQHMNAKGHYVFECAICDDDFMSTDERNSHEKAEHCYCRDCKRAFRSMNNLRMHLRSRVHIGQNMVCPFCKRGLASATGLAHHLETGSCPRASNLNRDEIYRLVRSVDPRGQFSKNLIGWKGSSEWGATEQAWNGDYYECYFCHREFDTLPSLNQHLQSPAHQQALYHCPKAGCRKDFKTLAAMINHFESESCGFTRFSKVQAGIQNLVDGNRLLAF